MPGWVLALVVSHLICYGLPDLVCTRCSLVLDQHLAFWPYQVLHINRIATDRTLLALYMQQPESAFDRWPP